MYRQRRPPEKRAGAAAESLCRSSALIAASAIRILASVPLAAGTASIVIVSFQPLTESSLESILETRQKSLIQTLSPTAAAGIPASPAIPVTPVIPITSVTATHMI